jgi:FMN phosphatase YigB (HAD superfamily)
LPVQGAVDSLVPIKAIFFDIGNTLGTVDLTTKTLTPFADMLAFLKAASRLFQVPIGVITDIPESWEKHDIETLLSNAGLLTFLDASGIITSKDAKATKSEGPHIFTYAAKQLNVKTCACFFIDDDAANVANACAAGMSAMQKVAP